MLRRMDEKSEATFSLPSKQGILRGLRKSYTSRPLSAPGLYNAAFSGNSQVGVRHFLAKLQVKVEKNEGGATPICLFRERFTQRARRKRSPLDKVLNIDYILIMKEIRRSSVFDKWFKKLRDDRAAAYIHERIDRLAFGTPGDVGPVGEGISELRIHYGPGYRVYYKDTGKEIIILLCGGDKSTQQTDIKRAKKIVKLYEEE